MDNFSERELRHIRREQNALQRERTRLRQELSQQRDRYLQQQRDMRLERDRNPVRIGPTQVIPPPDHQTAKDPSVTDVITGEIIDDDRHTDEEDKEKYYEEPFNRTEGDSFFTLDQTHGSAVRNEGQESNARETGERTFHETGTRPKDSRKDQRSLEQQELALYRRINALRSQSRVAKKELEDGFGQQRQGLEQVVRRELFPSEGEEFSEGYTYTPSYGYERASAPKVLSASHARVQKDEMREGERRYSRRIKDQGYEDILSQRESERPIPCPMEYSIEADRLNFPSRGRGSSIKTDQDWKKMGQQREEVAKQTLALREQDRQTRDGNSMFVSEQTTEEERILQDKLEKLVFQEKILEEENREREREEAEISEMLKLIKIKQSQLEEDRRKSQRLIVLKEKQEKLEISLKRKIEEQIRHEERIRLLRQEERKLTAEVTKTEPYPFTNTQESERIPKIDFELKPPEENDREKPSQEIIKSDPLMENRETDATITLKLEELNRKEAYLKQLESDLTKKEEDIRAKLDLKPTQVPGNKTQEIKSEKEASVKAAVTHLVKPYINTFSGTEPIPKNESSFEEWKLETEYLAKSEKYSDETINLAIRHSLKGQARKVLVTLGPLATSEQIVNKLENVFGNVASGESVLQEFYTASQKSDESVTLWGIRIEEILKKAIDKGHVSQEQKNNMLKTKFWRALYSTELKNATRVHFESINSFELLRRKVRAEEYEIATNKSATNKDSQLITKLIKSETHKEKSSATSTSTAQHQPVLQDPNTKLLRDLAKRMEAMEKTLESFSKSRTYNKRWQDRRPATNQNQNKPQAPKVPSPKVPSQKDDKQQPKNQSGYFNRSVECLVHLYHICSASTEIASLQEIADPETWRRGVNNLCGQLSLHAEYTECIVAQKSRVHQCLQQNEINFQRTIDGKHSRKSIKHNLCRYFKGVEVCTAKPVEVTCGKDIGIVLTEFIQSLSPKFCTLHTNIAVSLISNSLSSFMCLTLIVYTQVIHIKL